MKNLLTILLVFLVHFVNGQTTILKGTVTDNTGEVLMFANVIIYQNGQLITGTQTDFDGKYQFDSLTTGSYDIEVSYMSYEKKKIVGVVLFPNKYITLNIEMLQAPQIIDCPIYIPYPPLYNADNLTQGTTFSAKEIQRSPHKN